ncbi:MAG: ATP-binding protein [Chloroflexota bacterium]|nr:ATP-binding protein [Chloroflexota bacterium]
MDDAVHFATAEQLRAVYPQPSETRVRIGRLASATTVPLTLNAKRAVVRHMGIVGSTGAGKSSAAASLVQAFVKGGWPGAKIVIIDPHGEYPAAFDPVSVAVRSVDGVDAQQLAVPYWALPAGDILRALSGISDPGATASARFGELVADARIAFAEDAAWLDLEPAEISADSPIPFEIANVWYQLEYENRATYSQSQGNGEPELDDVGEAAALRPPRFRAPAMGAAAPFKGPRFGLLGTMPDRVRAGLRDERLAFLRRPVIDPGEPDPLPRVMESWLGTDKPISVLDFSGVPAVATDLAVGVILQLLFEAAVRGGDQGIGRARPVLVVLEEAHRYLLEGPSVRLARESVNRIAREGRKYGIGVTLVTQRPSELPDTALAQLGTIIALRLTNAADQARVRAALPDAVAGLADTLPALRTGEAIVSGEAVELPTRVLIDPPSPPPAAEDPNLASWRVAGELDLAETIRRWREG